MILKTVLILIGCVCLAGTLCAMAFGLVWLSIIASVFTVGVWFVISHVGDDDDGDSDDAD